MSRDALKIELYSLLSKNGFAFTSQGVDSFTERLLAEQFVQDGSGAWWSPSGEPLIDAIYRSWGDSAPVTSHNKSDERAASLPYSEADIAATKDPFTRASMIGKNEEALGKIPSAAVKQGKLPPGMTQEQFMALTPDQKIAAANEATRIANGYSAGGVGF